MNLRLYAPSPAAAVLMAQRLRPGAKVGAVRALADSVDPDHLAASWRAIKRQALSARRHRPPTVMPRRRDCSQGHPFD